MFGHVRGRLDKNIAVFWVGARTNVSPGEDMLFRVERLRKTCECCRLSMLIGGMLAGHSISG